MNYRQAASRARSGDLAACTGTTWPLTDGNPGVPGSGRTASGRNANDASNTCRIVATGSSMTFAPGVLVRPLHYHLPKH